MLSCVVRSVGDPACLPGLLHWLTEATPTSIFSSYETCTLQAFVSSGACPYQQHFPQMDGAACMHALLGPDGVPPVSRWGSVLTNVR